MSSSGAAPVSFFSSSLLSLSTTSSAVSADANYEVITSILKSVSSNSGVFGNLIRGRIHSQSISCILFKRGTLFARRISPSISNYEFCISISSSALPDLAPQSCQASGN